MHSVALGILVVEMQHSAFIGNRRIYCVEEEKVEGHRVFECRKIDFRRMSNPWAAQEKK